MLRLLEEKTESRRGALPNHSRKGKAVIFITSVERNDEFRSAGRFRCSGRTRGATLRCLVRIMHRCFKCEMTSTRIFAEWKEGGRPRTGHGDSYSLIIRRKVYLRKIKGSFGEFEHIPSVLWSCLQMSLRRTACCTPARGNVARTHARRTQTHTPQAKHNCGLVLS